MNLKDEIKQTSLSFSLVTWARFDVRIQRRVGNRSLSILSKPSLRAAEFSNFCISATDGNLSITALTLDASTEVGSKGKWDKPKGKRRKSSLKVQKRTTVSFLRFKTKVSPQKQFTKLINAKRWDFSEGIQNERNSLRLNQRLPNLEFSINLEQWVPSASLHETSMCLGNGINRRTSPLEAENEWVEGFNLKPETNQHK